MTFSAMQLFWIGFFCGGSAMGLLVILVVIWIGLRARRP